MSVVAPPSSATAAAAPSPIRSLDDVPGWLARTDKLLFKWLLMRQAKTEPPGDLLELGVYQGKSAIHMARYMSRGEKLTVCDLFDLAVDEQTIRPGARKAYADLTQRAFERNFLAFHDTLPTIVRGRTDVILNHVSPQSCRFVHIDASHMYEHVREDLRSARQLLQPDGLVVFDDYRTEHTPGTAAAIWEAMATDGLKVVCVSGKKFYGTWGDPTAMQQYLSKQVARQPDHRCSVYSVMEQRLLLIRVNKTEPRTSGDPAATPARRVPRAGGRPSGSGAAQGIALAPSARGRDSAAPLNANRKATTRPAWRRLAKTLLPAAAVTAIRKRRR